MILDQLRLRESPTICAVLLTPLQVRETRYYVHFITQCYIKPHHLNQTLYAGSCGNQTTIVDLGGNGYDFDGNL